MTCSNNTICMRKFGFALSAAFVLASCTADETDAGHSAISGSDDFLEIVAEARLAIDNGNLPEAGRLYDEALTIDGANSGLWVDIARLRFRGGEHLSAIEAADNALELDNSYGPAILLRAQLVRDAHGLEASLPWFEAAVAADPRNPEVVGDYAATLGDLGRYSDMLSVVRDLADFAPAYPQVHYLQAVLAARANDPVLSSNLLIRSGLVGQGVPAAMMLDAVVNMQQGNFDTAAETLEALAERQPANSRIDELLARAFWLSGRDRELVDRFAARAEQGDATASLVMMVGRSFERLGERGRAIGFIQRAQQARASDPIVLENSGTAGFALPAPTAELRVLIGNRQNVSAEGRVRALLARFPLSGDIHTLAGDAALANGNAQLALERYEVAARVRRSWPLTRKLVHAYRVYGDDQAADILLARYIAGDPQNTDALLLQAKSSAAKEDWLRVEVLLDAAIELGAGNDLEVLALRAQAADELGREEDAVRFDALRAELKPAEFVAD